MTPLQRAAVRLAQELERRRTPYMLIGGFAVGLWGHPRTTVDVDATAWVSETEIKSFLAALGRRFRFRSARPLEAARRAHHVQLETRDGVRIDLSFGRLPFEREAMARAPSLDIGARKIRVAAVDDLIFYKVVADRPQDHADVAALVARHRRRINRRVLDRRVREVAAAAAQPELYQRYLEAWKRRD